MYKKKLLYLSLAACMMGMTPNVNLHAEEKSVIVQDQGQSETSTEVTENPTNDTHVEESTTEASTHQKHETHKKEAHKNKKKVKKKNTKKKNSKKKENKNQEKKSKKNKKAKKKKKKQNKAEQKSIKTYAEMSLEKKNHKEYVGSYVYFNQANEAYLKFEPVFYLRSYFKNFNIKIKGEKLEELENFLKPLQSDAYDVARMNVQRGYHFKIMKNENFLIV